MRNFIIKGYLVVAPDVKDDRANFSIAVNEYFEDKDGNKQEKAYFFNIVCFKKFFFDRLKQLTTKDSLCVEGKIEPSSYEKEGIKVTTFNFIANDIDFLKRFPKNEV